ncbi:MAG TPA: hypothetical protein VFN39_08255 [Gemmatimonadaceae bacterium]|nr:hypothetical protein [Gemmatimonadaceae bacterium]
MRLSLIVGALLLLVPTRALRAQYADIGDTIRIVLAGDPIRITEGNLAGVNQDSIFITRAKQPSLRLARGAVKGLFVSRDGGDLGVGGGWAGTSLGFIVGGVGGAAVAGPRIVGRMLGAVGGAVLGMFIGATAGEAIGSHQHYRVWVAIPWPSTPLAEPGRP